MPTDKSLPSSNKHDYFTPGQSYCCIQNRFTLFNKKPARNHCSINESNPVSTKIYPQFSFTSFARNPRTGNEFIRTNNSKPLDNLEANKYNKYKDASQFIHKKSAITQSINKRSMAETTTKDVYPFNINRALQRVRNRGSSVPKKVQNRPTHHI